jgi:hypothetical protein
MKKTKVENCSQYQKNELSRSEMPSVGLQDVRIDQQREGQKDETYYGDQDITLQDMEEIREKPK